MNRIETVCDFAEKKRIDEYRLQVIENEEPKVQQRKGSKGIRQTVQAQQPFGSAPYLFPTVFHPNSYFLLIIRLASIVL